MNEQEKKMLIIDVRLTRGVVTLAIAGLVMLAVLGYLMLVDRSVAASDEPAAAGVAQAAPDVSINGLRRYYRTTNTYTSVQALSACGAGYHFASLWELLDPSNLEYASYHPDAWFDPYSDMGSGPSTGGDGYPRVGWVRTGYNSSGTTGIAGQDNCNAWTSVDPSHYGTTAGLSHQWDTAEDIFVWNVGVDACNYSTGVWCVED